MKTPQTRAALAGFSLAFAAALTPVFAVNTTYEWTSATLGGNWSVSGNWTVVSGSDTAVPGAGGDIGRLGDVTSGTRTVIYDSAAGGFVSTIQFNQSTAGAVNELRVSRALTVSNAIDLSAVAGVERITVDSGLTLTASGGLIVGTNGELALQGTAAVSGSVTVSGGTVTVAAVTGSSSVSSAFGGTFSMSAGSIVIENTGAGNVADRRLAFNGDVNITGGSISTTSTGTAGGVFINGATSVLNLTTPWDAGMALYLGRDGDQSLTTNQSFAGASLTLRGHGVKTITRTEGETINGFTFLDAHPDSRGPSLRLGSNLTLLSGAAMPSVSTWGNSGTTLQVGIDSNGHTLDLTTGASAGKWTPNHTTQAGVNTTVWTLSNSGAAGVGGIRANAFDFSATGAEVNVGSGLVLTAVGGAGTSSNLGSAGAFDSAARFVYAGNATSADAATLSSGRAIGALQVRSGYLRTTGTTFNAAGGIIVDSGATLDFTTVALTAPSITLGIDGAGAAQITAGSYTYADSLFLNFGSAAVAGTYDLFDFSGTVTSGLGSVSLTGLHSLALSGESGVWTGTTGGYTFTFTEATGDLVVSAIPEPSTFGLLAGVVTLGVCAIRRRRRE